MEPKNSISNIRFFEEEVRKVLFSDKIDFLKFG
jgi:hypothetical protein